MKLTEKKDVLAKLYVELDGAQKEIDAGTVSQTRGEEIEAKAKEAEALQKEIDQAERIAGLAAKGREVAEVVLPTGKSNAESKGRGAGMGSDGSPIVGFKSVGAMFADSPELANYLQSGAPAGVGSAPFAVKNLHEKFIPVTEKMVETKAVPTLTGVIQADRVAEVVRTTENDRLHLRDLLQVSQTGSSSVEYVVLSSYTRAAAPVAESAAKPEAALAATTATAPVRTLAVHMPVTEQQLQDVAGIRSMIDNELLYDLRKLEEEQFMYGSGAGQNLQGLLTLAGVTAVTRTAPSATQNIDRIKIAATDVMVAGGEPNGVAIHPIDWEAVVLQKGTDNRYIWAMIETDNGPRIWGMNVVETVAMKNPANLQRFFLVGDFIRGATVWDREQASIAVGWINAQFTQNLRTIRAEERLAFGIKRPAFFKKYETATAV